jgi:hypothetical protein
MLIVCLITPEVAPIAHLGDLEAMAVQVDGMTVAAVVI